MEEDLTAVVVSKVVFPDKGKPCRHGKNNRYPINCMQHDFKHVVGAGCYKCNKHWFWEDDWRSDECRMEDKAKELAHEFMLGFRDNLGCADVSPSEYESVMAHKINNLVLEYINGKKEG